MDSSSLQAYFGSSIRSRPMSSKRDRDPFPIRLRAMLDEASIHGFDDIVAWVRETHFRVYQPILFEQKIVHRYFDSTKYKSFTRQLNLYGFQRVRSKFSVLDGCYCHPHFRRDQPELVWKIVRESTKLTKEKDKKNHPTNDSVIQNPRNSKEMTEKGILADDLESQSSLIPREGPMDLSSTEELYNEVQDNPLLEPIHYSPFPIETNPDSISNQPLHMSSESRAQQQASLGYNKSNSQIEHVPSITEIWARNVPEDIQREILRTFPA